MSGVDIDVSIGEVRIEGDLNRVLRHGSLPFMRAIVRSVQDEIERTCPVGATGNLRDSSYARLDERTAAIEVGATMDYAAAVHDGHVTANGGWVEGRPWLRHSVMKFTHGRIGS